MSKKTYYSVKRDLLERQKRPTTASKETHVAHLLLSNHSCLIRSFRNAARSEFVGFRGFRVSRTACTASAAIERGHVTGSAMTLMTRTTTSMVLSKRDSVDEISPGIEAKET